MNVVSGTGKNGGPNNVMTRKNTVSKPYEPEER